MNSGNPWRSKELDDDREHMRRVDPVGYDNVYEGNVREFAEGAYFREGCRHSNELVVSVTFRTTQTSQSEHSGT